MSVPRILLPKVNATDGTESVASPIGATQGQVDISIDAGTITVKIPPGTSSGKRLRIKAQGIKTAKGEKGDLLVEVQIALPSSLDAESLELIRRIDERNPAQPRTDLAW